VSIAGLGIREGTLVFLLARYQIAPTAALALSLLVFARNLVPIVLGGVLELQSCCSARLPPGPRSDREHPSSGVVLS
jgi:hypothetical protein